MAFIDPNSAGGQNVCAFLDTIAHAEGTEKYSPEGYQTIVGGDTFTDFSDHPRKRVYLPRYKIYSTAAGRYQLIQATWDSLKQRLRLPDFSPLCQDRAAIELIRENGALDDVRSGRFADAVEKCRKTWASLPGAGYGQREVALNELERVYVSRGGTTRDA